MSAAGAPRDEPALRDLPRLGPSARPCAARDRPAAHGPARMLQGLTSSPQRPDCVAGHVRFKLRGRRHLFCLKTCTTAEAPPWTQGRYLAAALGTSVLCAGGLLTGWAKFSCPC